MLMEETVENGMKGVRVSGIEGVHRRKGATEG